ncbi:MAG: toluene monooxygenase system ferredoxin subunit [Gammaproteobacteria bacterium]
MSNVNEFHKICHLDDVWEGEMEVFDLEDEEVLIVHAPGGEVRAYHASCPHQDHPLAEGEFEDCILTCSAHHWRFDVISGEGVNPTGTSLIKFPMKIENDEIWVALPADFE